MTTATAGHPEQQPTLPTRGLGSTSSASSLVLPQEGEFGGYILLNEIARGGMGVVYKARQKSLDRLVALKMILSGKLAGEDDLKRFRTEAEAAARLRHRNIVTVFEVGELDGQHYFSMEYIEGQTLAQLLTLGTLSCKTAARHLVAIARAVHHAHQQGILHRDLKPSNIMIDAAEEPHVTDFGLAKRFGDTAANNTQSGSILGTPSYMAPEQAAGKTREIGPACDVYGLGAVLYECLTGRPPFHAETPLDTLMQVLEHDPPPPRTINPTVDADLETICLKCLEKDPKLRYASAEVLADDLQRYLNGESIHARSYNVLDRLQYTLERGQHDADFHHWSTMVFIIAAIVFVEHVLVFLMVQVDTSNFAIGVTRLLQFALIGAVFWRKRGASLMPTTPSERELWTIWLGYFVSYGAAYLVTRSLVLHDVLGRGCAAPEKWDNLILYPISSVLSGLAFFMMGSNYWGRCYAFGLSFMILAIGTTLILDYAPLAFGILWTYCLCSLGFRLRQLGRHTTSGQPVLSPHDALTVNSPRKA